VTSTGRRRSVIASIAWCPFVLHLAASSVVSDGVTVSRLSVVALVLSSVGLAAWSMRHLAHSGMASLFVTSASTSLWYAYPGALLVASATYRQQALGSTELSDRDLTAIAGVELFFGLVVMFSLLKGREGGGLPKVWIGTTSPERLVGMGLICVGVGFAPMATMGPSLSSTVQAVADSRRTEKDWVTTDNVGNARSALLVLTSSLGVAGGTALLTAGIFRSAGTGTRIASLVAGLVTGVLFAVDTGTRAIVVLLFVPPFGAWLISRRILLKRSSVAWLMAGAIVLFVAQRELLVARNPLRPFGVDETVLDVVSVSGTIDFFSETIHSFSFVPGLHDWFREHFLVQFATNPVPRFLWKGKPTSSLGLEYAYWRWGVDIYAGKGNVLPGVVGQEYMSWGWLGVVEAAAVMGLLAVAVERMARAAVSVKDPAAIAASVMVGAWVVLSYRMLSPGILYPVITFVALVTLARRRLKKAKATDPAEKHLVW